MGGWSGGVEGMMRLGGLLVTEHDSALFTARANHEPHDLRGSRARAALAPRQFVKAPARDGQAVTA